MRCSGDGWAMATVLSFRWNGGMQEFGRVPFVSCGQGRKTRVRGEGGQRCLDACYLPRRGATKNLTPDNPGTNSPAPKQIPLRQNIAHRQPIPPALAARGGCRRSGLAQKCCLRLAFAFDSDMESGNGRVPEPGCRVTD